MGIDFTCQPILAGADSISMEENISLQSLQNLFFLGASTLHWFALENT